MYILLAIIGAAIGALVNACIYWLGEIKSPASPWITAPPKIRRKLVHYLPVIGWLMRRGESRIVGRAFWIRPLLIELVWIIGLPFFYIWICNDGLTANVPPPAGWHLVWFVGYTILFTLLFVATFIDFDQRIIPDGITVTGTLIALVIAAAFPSFRLPKLVAGLAGMTVESVHFADGALRPTWHCGVFGLIIGLVVFVVWILALLPKHPLTELNIRGLKLVFVSTVRLLQSNGLKLRERARKQGLTLLTIGLIGSALIAINWSTLPGSNWTSLFGGIVGMGLGGLSIWLVRIVATHSLGQEAMGFGDVTLMAMIGAFLGWQAALITFALSPFAAIAIALINFLITKDNQLAFGPYLCLGAMITIFRWSVIWPKALPQFFAMPFLLMAVLTASLFLLMIMMVGVRKIKGLDNESTEDTSG